MKKTLFLVLFFTCFQFAHGSSTRFIFTQGDYKVFFLYNLEDGIIDDAQALTDHYNAKAINKIRETLAAQKRIMDIPVIYNMLRSGLRISYRPSFEAESEGRAYYTFDDCYVIDLGQENYDLREYIFALQRENNNTGELPMEEFQSMRKDWQDEFNASIQAPLVFNYPAPDMKKSVSVQWKDDQASFSLVSKKGDPINGLGAPEGVIASEPLWSGNSRYVAYASLLDVKIYDIMTGKEKTTLEASIADQLRRWDYLDKVKKVELRFSLDNSRLRIIFEAPFSLSMNCDLVDELIVEEGEKELKDISETSVQLPLYTVLIDTASTVEDAEAVIKTFKQYNLDPYFINSGGEYQVCVGKFNAGSEAENYAEIFLNDKVDNYDIINYRAPYYYLPDE
jgi:hypothetical protein